MKPDPFIEAFKCEYGTCRRELIERVIIVRKDSREISEICALGHVRTINESEGEGRKAA